MFRQRGRDASVRASRGGYDTSRPWLAGTDAPYLHGFVDLFKSPLWRTRVDSYAELFTKGEHASLIPIPNTAEALHGFTSCRHKLLRAMDLALQRQGSLRL